MKKVWIYVLVVVIVVVIIGVMVNRSEPATSPTSTESDELDESEKDVPALMSDEEKLAAGYLESPFGLFDPENPQQTELLDVENLPKSVTRIRPMGDRLSPDGISGQAGGVKSLILLEANEAHSLVFDSPDLSNVRIETGILETRGISFLIPEDASGKTYTFYCDEPGHREAGEVGEMLIP